MKKISAFVKPFKLEALLTRLPEEGVTEVLVSEVRGYGRQKGHLEQYKGEEYEYTFLPKARVEVYCEDAAVAEVEKALLEGARTGRIGDGKIIVAPVEQSEQV
ncbi:MAG TPA: P-II family nitrogen regulator [Planctomycetota bacterium]|nr:P-II family nitrogen regulator [Planctomycetota bacterium]